MIEEKYFELPVQEMCKKLMHTVLVETDSAKPILEKLLQSEIYQKEDKVKLAIDAAWAVLSYIQGEPGKHIEIWKEIEERATKLEFWIVLIFSQSLLGVLYHNKQEIEQALECYKRVIQLEKKYGIVDTSSTAYNNIGILYIELEDYEKALKCMSHAIKLTEEAGLSQLDYYSKIVSYKSSMVIILCLLNMAEHADDFFREIAYINLSKVTIDAAYNHNLAKIFYAFYTSNFQEAKQVLTYAKEHIIKGRIDLTSDMLDRYFMLCEKYNLEFSFYADEVSYIEELAKKEKTKFKADVYKFLSRYYTETGNVQKAKENMTEYVKLLEEKDRKHKKSKVASLGLVNRLVDENYRLSEVEVINARLKREVEEATRYKSALQEVYQRIELVNELGKRATSSLNLSKVIEMTYNNLCDAITIDSLMVAVVEPEENRFRSIAYYKDKVLQPEFVVSLDNPNSLFVECYNTRKTILSDNIHNDERYREFKLIYFLNEIKASIFIPLRIGERIVGIFSIQSKREATYDFDHIMLLEGLVPYLSIAVNNAIYSEKLEHEIKAHLETQAELRKANDKLETLSSLDGLTRISNRRDFEHKILSLMSKAEEAKETVTVIMVDIDNFKKYNDTYGHLVGDEALKIVAQVIRENLDKVEGLSARFGGEEFVCACAGLTFEEARRLGEKLCKDVYAKKVKHEAVPNGIMSISVGVAITKESSADKKSELMKQADVSLYEAKNTGKNKVIIKEVP